MVPITQVPAFVRDLVFEWRNVRTADLLFTHRTDAIFTAVILIGLSAADEVAVARFLRGEIRFDEIASYLRRGAALGSAQRAPASPDFGEILGVDRAVRTALDAAPALA